MTVKKTKISQPVKCFSTITENDETSRNSHLTSLPTKSLFYESNDDQDENFLSISSLDEYSDRLYYNNSNISNYAAGDVMPAPRQKNLLNEDELRHKFQTAYNKINSEMSEITWKTQPKLEKISNIFDAIESQTATNTENKSGIMFSHKSKKPKHYKLKLAKSQESQKSNKPNSRIISNMQKDATRERVSLYLGDNIISSTSVDKLRDAPENCRPPGSNQAPPELVDPSPYHRSCYNRSTETKKYQLCHKSRMTSNYSLVKDTNFKNKTDCNLYSITGKVKDDSETESRNLSVVNVYPFATQEDTLDDDTSMELSTSCCNRTETKGNNSVYVYNQHLEDTICISIDVAQERNIFFSPHQLASGDNPQSKLHTTSSSDNNLIPIISSESGDVKKSSHPSAKILSPVKEKNHQKLPDSCISEEPEFDRKSGDRFLHFRPNLITVDPESKLNAQEYIAYEDKEYDKKIAKTRKVTKVSRLYKTDMYKSSLFAFYLPLSHYYGVEEGFR